MNRILRRRLEHFVMRRHANEEESVLDALWIQRLNPHQDPANKSALAMVLRRSKSLRLIRL